MSPANSLAIAASKLIVFSLSAARCNLSVTTIGLNHSYIVELNFNETDKIWISRKFYAIIN